MILIKDGSRLHFKGSDALTIRRIAMQLNVPEPLVINWIEAGYREILLAKKWRRLQDGTYKTKA